jgi:RND family efflux transporter MFP subunit
MLSGYIINIMRYIYILFLGAAIGSLVWFGSAYVLPPNVDLITPTRGEAVQAVYATGTVEPTVMIPVAPRIAARLIALNVDEGAQVKQGDILAQFEDTDVRNSVRQLQAQLQLATSNFERAQSLIEKGAVSRKSLDQSRADLDSAQANLERGQAEADYLKLTAPADGLIIRRDGEIGTLITAGTPLFYMACCAPLRITAEVDEEDIPDVKIGQQVLIQSDAFPDQTYDGKVLSITPKGDPVARSYRVRISLPEAAPMLIGMTAETNIIIHQNEQALLVPMTAVMNGKVWTVEKNKLVSHQVKTGASNKDQLEIISGIDDTTQIITNPQEDFKNGARVRAHLTKP